MGVRNSNTYYKLRKKCSKRWNDIPTGVKPVSIKTGIWMKYMHPTEDRSNCRSYRKTVSVQY